MIKQLDLFAAFEAAEAKPVIKPAASKPVEVKKEPVRISAAVRKAFEQEVREFGWSYLSDMPRASQARVGRYTSRSGVRLAKV